MFVAAACGRLAAAARRQAEISITGARRRNITLRTCCAAHFAPAAAGTMGHHMHIKHINNIDMESGFSGRVGMKLRRMKALLRIFGALS
jgi:hypothetical protein